MSDETDPRTPGHLTSEFLAIALTIGLAALEALAQALQAIYQKDGTIPLTHATYAVVGAAIMSAIYAACRTYLKAQILDADGDRIPDFIEAHDDAHDEPMQPAPKPGQE